MSALELIQLTRALEDAEKRIAVLEAALREAIDAIEALSTTQKDVGLGLLGSILAPISLKRLRSALAPATKQAGE